jgi:type IV fimbrial biogenesis protein FimT
VRHISNERERRNAVIRKRAAGVTLFEMMISMSIMAIIGSLAVPGFSDLMLDNSRAIAVNNFVHALYLARSESIKRGSVVSICKTLDGETCANDAQWSGGWMVFANDDRDELPVRDVGEAVIHVYEGWRDGSINSNRAAYSFRPYAQSVVNGTLVFCDRRGGAAARAIIISHTGRPRISQKDSSNKPLKCPAM